MGRNARIQQVFVVVEAWRGERNGRRNGTGRCSSACILGRSPGRIGPAILNCSPDTIILHRHDAARPAAGRAVRRHPLLATRGSPLGSCGCGADIPMRRSSAAARLADRRALDTLAGAFNRWFDRSVSSDVAATGAKIGGRSLLAEWARAVDLGTTTKQTPLPAWRSR